MQPKKPDPVPTSTPTNPVVKPSGEPDKKPGKEFTIKKNPSVASLKSEDSNKPRPKKPAEKNQTLSNQGLVEKICRQLRDSKIKSAFLFKDLDSANKGVVSVFELKQELERMLPKANPQELFALLKILDVNSNGLIDKKEFEVIMVNTQDELSELRDSRLEELSNKSTTSLSAKGGKPAKAESEKGKATT